MSTVLKFDESEAKELFEVLKDELNHRIYTRRESPWPLYDKVAEYLGENTSGKHIDVIHMQWEEEKVDEWREAAEMW